MMAQFGSPVSMLLAGPLADRVFEPGMRQGGALAGVFGPLVGTGPGAGMALMLVFGGRCRRVRRGDGARFLEVTMAETGDCGHGACVAACAGYLAPSFSRNAFWTDFGTKLETSPP
ncbi:MAG: hypothetical protein NTV92_03665, partial [Candidatus Bipolaricaulota bacterium]|nr:hypothetical protein [Candidatus Bipolaricaulota bacterium]